MLIIIKKERFALGLIFSGHKSFMEDFEITWNWLFHRNTQIEQQSLGQ